MERVHNKSNELHPDVHQQEGRDLHNVRNDGNSSINQETQQTSGIQSCALVERNQTSQQASEAERDQFYEEQRIMENMKSSILSCNIAVAEEMRKLIVSTEEQKKQIRDFLEMQDSREVNVVEAKHRNEALDLELQISQKNIHEMEAQLSCLQDICMDLQQHYIPVSVTLERCVKAKDDIVRYYADIRNQIREGDELYKVQSIQLKNKAECCMQQAVQEMETRKENTLLADKTKIEMDQKIEEVAAEISALEQNCAVLDDGIRQKMAKKESLVSGIMQELKEVNEKVKNAQQKNEGITAEEETQKSLTTKLEISRKEVTSDNDVLKDKILCMQQAIYEAGKRKQAFSEEMEQVKAAVVAEEVENHRHDSVLEKKGNVRGELTSQLEQYKCEVKDKREAISKLQDSCKKNQEDVETLQEELQAEQLQQETVASEHKSEVTDMLAQLESEKKKSCDIDSELQRDEQTVCELLERIQDVRGLNGSVLLEHEMLKEDIAKTRSRTAELQVQANEETEHKQKTEEELTRVEACLQESQNFLGESNKTHEEFIFEVTKEKCEMDEELKNAQLELQNSIVSHDRMVQETMTLVNESRQSYAQHIEMKDAALTACRNDFHSLTQQVEEASAEKDKLETKWKAEMKTLEDTVNQLAEKLVKKRAENQPQAASTPFSLALPQLEQISSSDDHRFPHSILKSPAVVSVASNKQVQFFGMSSDSDISLLDEPILSARNMKSLTVKRPASKHECTSYTPKSLSQNLPVSPEDTLKDMPARRSFKSRSKPTGKTGSQTVQDKYNASHIKSKN